MKPQQESLFDRIISRPRHPWFKVGFVFLIILAPFIAALANGALKVIFQTGAWRGILVQPVIITYILIVSPGLSRVEIEVRRSFQALLLLEEDNTTSLLNSTGNMKPAREILALSIGILFGVGFTFISTDGLPAISWIFLEWILANSIMYGLLAWTIYGSIAGSRMTTALLRQPLRIDPFDISPFEPIGRHSLLIALVFAGGLIISLVFVGINPELLRRLEFWLVYLPLLLIPILIFFATMQPTHRILAAAKERELKIVQGHFDRSCRELLQALDNRSYARNLSSEITALSVYISRLQAARTWPYNTTMLRTLFFSVLIPVGTALARIIIELMRN